MMPDMDGFEVYCQLKEHGQGTIPVIFITTLSQAEEESRGLDMGAVDYIHKPYNMDLVKLRIRNQLELKHQRDLIEQQRIELENMLAVVKQLEGIIPICMYCKKIRDDNDYWHQLEQYISTHSEAVFSHGICPTCFEKHNRD
jgi:response regulator RpfG family c-di-GMP phosphodiesterase